MNDILAARATLEEAAREVVPRHRARGILTWALLHQMVPEVLTEAAATGRHHPQILAMLRVPDEMGYPKDGSMVSFAGHELIPFVFCAIDEAWRRVH